jgi:hypothetical protein
VAKEFRMPVSQDYKIVEDDKVVGTIRIKPSTLMWKAKSARSWKGVTVEAFGTWAEKHGTDMAK